MLFQSKNVLESEKERNFYSKVFAGYYFNELVPGYEARLRAFLDLLSTRKERTFSGQVDKRLKLSPEKTHVTFDFHGYLLAEENDKGELADILISDPENGSAIAIEVKFLSNWDFEDDIMAASRRFKSLLGEEKISSFVHVLLVTQAKLDGVRKAAGQKGSNWTKLSREKLRYPLVVLTWEDIAGACEGTGGELVGSFIHQHIKESRESFRAQARQLLGVEKR